ncbi:MAG: enoyl-CoA hydratase/isomerase family protein [Gammaproteobacteria bacterium]|nr:enoyl-CoA hydratase/isomerase family protein [Gammaproteobacteria bacterium]
MAEMNLTTADGNAVLTMHNGGLFNRDTLEQFNQCLDQVEVDDSLRALLITGEGKIFAQGLDLETLKTLDVADFYQFVENTMVMAARLLTFPVPVMSVVNGHAFGLGAMIALASDFRVMRADRGFLCLPEIDLKMPFTLAMNALVTNTLSGEIRRDMMIAGRRLGGEDAARYGVVDACCSEQELMQTARQILAPALDKDRDAFSKIKRGLNLPILQVIEASDGVRG